MVGIPKDLFAEGGPFYRPEAGKAGSKPVKNPGSPKTKPGSGKLHKFLKSGNSGMQGVESFHEAMEALAKLAGYKPDLDPEAQVPPELVEKMNAAAKQLAAETGQDTENLEFGARVCSLRQMYYSMKGLGMMSAAAACGERGIAMLRWFFKNVLVGEHDGLPLDYRLIMRVTKRYLRKFCDEHRGTLKGAPGQYYVAAVTLTSSEASEFHTGSPLTPPHYAVLFMAAYELENDVEWDDHKPPGPNDDLPAGTTYSADTEEFIKPFKPADKPPGGKFDG